MNAELSTTCAIQLRKANVSRTNLAENRHALRTKHASVLHKTKHKSEQDRGASLTANRTQGVLLLRSPSATTTGHPLCDYAGNLFQNKAVRARRITAVIILILKDLQNRMRAHRREKKFTSAVCCRLSEEQAHRVSELADVAGLTASDWARQAIVAALDCPLWARLMLGEFLALRSVVVDLQRDLIQGVNPSTERVKAILDVAEMRKFALADGRLATLRTAKETVAK
jgi:hypothetical protein